MANHFPTIAWAIGNNVYEVNIRQYTPEGTFAAFAQHLPRLKDMGVGIIWLMPITPISAKERLGTLGSYYACSSYVQVNEEFGTLTDFENLVSDTHRLGMKIIIDWVANHTGWDHNWALQNPEWYLKDDFGNFTEKNGWKDVIDLDFTVPAMRNALLDAMKFWVTNFNIDGFRCDMAHLIPLDFWQEARTVCDAIKPLFWLAECEEIDYHNVFDVTYAWKWMHNTESLVKNVTSIPDMYALLHDYAQYPNDCYKLFFTANHDENSWNGTEYEKFGVTAKALAVLSCTWQRVLPLIYSGQESPNKKRLEFFNKDLIEWQHPTQLHEFYKTLLTLHHTPAIAQGETFILPTQQQNITAYLRRKEEAIVLVILNLSTQNKVLITIEHKWLNGDFKNVFSGFTYKLHGTEVFEMQAGEYILYEKVIVQ